MEKTIQLDQKELGQMAQADQFRTQALAVVGALSLDMETARKNLDAAQERQQSCIRQALANRGIDRFENARAQNGVITVTVPDEPHAPSNLSGDINKMVERVNGSAEARE
jgi:hypothetical protein